MRNICIVSLPWAVLIFVLGSLCLVSGPVMHETDQASLLLGALELARGDSSFWGADFYNFDKQYAAYALLAVPLFIFKNLDPVWVTNGISMGIYFAGIAFLLCCRPPRNQAQSVLLASLFLTPLIWQHAAFAASNFIAAGLLFLAFGLFSFSNIYAFAGAVLLCALASAARLDTLAVLPLLAWLQFPRASFFRWCFSRGVLLVALAGVGAAVFGRLISTAPIKDFYEPFFNYKVYTAYALFGLGVAFFIFNGIFARLFLLGIRRSQIRQKIYYLLGAATLLPAYIYYSLQLFSTRHWTVLLTGLILFMFSKRGAALVNLKSFVSSKIQRMLVLSFIFLMALLPCFLGLRLESPLRPRLVLASGTELPSADGILTMGGYFERLLKMRKTGFRHDHNQPIWQNALTATYRETPGKKLIFLKTPMFAYYKLAAYLRGYKFEMLEDINDLEEEESFYVDWRSLVRSIPSWNAKNSANYYNYLKKYNYESVNPNGSDPFRIVVSTDIVNSHSDEQTEILIKKFRGNEFVSFALPEKDKTNFLWPGYSVAIFSKHPFQIIFTDRNKKQHKISSVKYGSEEFIFVPGKDSVGMRSWEYRSKQTGDAPQYYRSVFPWYMDVSAY